MSRRMIVLGAGGHARVVVALARALGYEVIGCTDGDPALAGTRLLGVPVIGGDEAAEAHAPGDVVLALGIGSNGPPRLRRKMFEAFRARGYRFPALVHPAAVVDDSARLGEGVQVMAGAIVQPLAVIGDNTIVNTRVVVEHDCQVGPHVHLATACVLAGGARVGELCHVGAGATLRNGVGLGEAAVVGVGAAVVADVPAAAVVVGVPARPHQPEETAP